MASFSTYTENAVLNMLLNKAPYTSTEVYLALFTSEAGLENNNPVLQTEVDDVSSYKRVPVSASGGYTIASEGVVKNVGELAFNTALEDWGLITHTALMDSGLTGTGNVLFWAPMANPRNVYVGDVIRVREGAHTITLS